MKLRGPAQFLALPLMTILKFKTLSLDTMKLRYRTTAYSMSLPLYPMAVLIPTYPQPWYLPCHMHLWHPLWTPSQHLLQLAVFMRPVQGNACQLQNQTGTQMTKRRLPCLEVFTLPPPIRADSARTLRQS